MDSNGQNFLMDIQKSQTLMQLKECNYLSRQFGLILTDEQIANLVSQRFEALKDTGRIEFGEGALKQIIEAFCDSVYITQENYEETIATLQELLYYYKNESMDTISDDELIDFMRLNFDGPCQGSLEYLGDTSLEMLCHNARYLGFGCDAADERENGEVDEWNDSNAF